MLGDEDNLWLTLQHNLVDFSIREYREGHPHIFVCIGALQLEIHTQANLDTPYTLNLSPLFHQYKKT